jgi:hypothetical protein
MSPQDAIPQIVNVTMFVTNAIVCSAAVRTYQRRARRSVLLIAISAGLGAVMTAVSSLTEVDIWRFASIVSIVDLGLWTTGCCLLFQELARAGEESAGAAPNGSPATPVSNPAIKEGPPSVT